MRSREARSRKSEKLRLVFSVAGKGNAWLYLATACRVRGGARLTDSFSMASVARLRAPCMSRLGKGGVAAPTDVGLEHRCKVGRGRRRSLPAGAGDVRAGGQLATRAGGGAGGQRGTRAGGGAGAR